MFNDEINKQYLSKMFMFQIKILLLHIKKIVKNFVFLHDSRFSGHPKQIQFVFNENITFKKFQI